MTGNKNAWRAPLAGLASVAMIATMGVTALSANATNGAASLSVPADAASQWTGETVVEAAGRNNSKATVVPEYGYADKDNNSVLTSDSAAAYAGTTLTNRSAGAASASGKHIGVNFQLNADSAQVIDGVEVSDASTWLSVLNGETLGDAHTIADRANYKYVTSWDLYDYNSGTLVEGGLSLGDLMDFSLNDNTNYKVKPAKVKVTKLATFNKPAAFGSDAYVQGAYTANGLNGIVYVDADPSDGYQVTAPDYVSSKMFDASNSTLFEEWTSQTADDVVRGGKVTLDENSTFDLTAATGVLVKFNSNGGSYVKPAVVGADKTVAEPTAPTRKGYTFIGWALPAQTGANWTADKRATETVDGVTYVRDFTGVYFNGSVELTAQWVSAKDVKVTFHYGSYEGAPKDTKSKFAPTDQLTAPDKPSREGYLFLGWTDVKGGSTAVSFVNKLAGEYANKTFYAIWALPGQADAQKAVDYVNMDDAKYFTKDSFDAFKTVWAKASLEYKQAKWDAYTKQVAADKANAIIDELSAAWKGLRFNTGKLDTTIDGKDDNKGGAKLVYRLANADGSRHFITTDEDELLARTGRLNGNILNITQGQGGWKLEPASTFRSVGANLKSVWYASDPSASADQGDGSLGLGYDTDKDQDGVYAAPALIEVVSRLYNPVSQEHLYTTDGHEVNVLTAGYGWSLDSAKANIYAPALYTTTTPVARFYNKATGLHFYTADKNEIQHWTGTGVWDNEGNKFYAL